ncbi:MAG: zinc-binding dehydrogenase [bacterium]
MKSYFLVEPGRIELREAPIPIPDKGDLVIKIESAMTCGTDLKAYRRGHPKMRMPTPFGHEFAGTIVDAGASANGYREGDAIMGAPTAPCGDCYYCRRHLENLCPVTMQEWLLGAYSEYIRIPRRLVERNFFIKPRSVSFEEAALLEPLACVVHGIDPLALQAEDTVVIIGAGPIGLLHVLMARRKGAHKIIMIGKHQHRLQTAEEFGADDVLNADAGNAIEAVRDITKTYGANWVFECTGLPEVWEQAVALASKGGSVIFFGGCPGGTSVNFDTMRLHYDEISLIGAFHYTPRDVAKAYELISENEIDLKKLITAKYPLQDLEKVFDLLLTGRGVKYAIQP